MDNPDLISDEADHPSNYWPKGLHLTREGEFIPLSKMSDEHLENAIRFFGQRNWDVSSLEEELKKREIPQKPFHI